MGTECVTSWVGSSSKAFAWGVVGILHGGCVVLRLGTIWTSEVPGNLLMKVD